jgi:hypothetical protein
VNQIRSHIDYTDNVVCVGVNAGRLKMRVRQSRSGTTRKITASLPAEGCSSGGHVHAVRLPGGNRDGSSLPESGRKSWDGSDAGFLLAGGRLPRATT